MAVDPILKVAARIADLERQVKSLSTSYQLGRTSFSDGTALPDVILASNRAVESAAQAVADASSALAKADGVVNTFYGDAEPVNPGVGDFWVKANGNAYIRTNDSPPVWKAVSDPDVAAALQAAQDAAAAADGKISTWFLPSTSPPPDPGVGDIWYVTDMQNQPRRWNGSTWDVIRDGKIQDALDAAADAQGDATTALNSANGKTRVVYSSNAPGSVQGTNNGDTWFRIDSSGTVLNQYRWTLPGATWVEVVPQSVTVASLDAGKITTGTLAAGVIITVGTPGGDRTEIRDNGFVGYIGGVPRFRLGGSTVSATADFLQSTGYLSTNKSYVRMGSSVYGDNIDNITFFQPGYNSAVLRNTLASGEGALEVALQSGSGSGKSYYFDTNSFSTDGTFSVRNRTYGVGMTITNVTNIGGSYGNLTAGGYFDQWYNTYGISLNIGYNASGIQVSYPPNGAYGTAFVRNTYSGGGALKFTSDNALQARTNNDGGYAYFRGIIQDQSNPELKENIVQISTDALAELSGMNRYAFDWKRDPTIPFMPPPRDSSTGLLLSEVPYSVQQTEDGYATGSLLGLLVAAVNQLNAKVDARG